MTREEFEREFHSRTIAYHPEYRSDDRAVVVVFGDLADSEPGHVLLVALVNLLARAHQKIVVVGDVQRPLRCFDHFRFGTLEGATVGLARAVNPFIKVRAQRSRFRGRALLTIGIAADGDLRLGCDGWLASTGPDTAVDTRHTSILGAGLAACLGAATAFHQLTRNNRVPTGCFSLWDYARASTCQGFELADVVDVGRVLQVGAGAVGGALDFWLGFIGLVGRWVVADEDVVAVSNLNRQLLFTAADAGFPDGRAANKAEAVAKRLGGHFIPSPYWYGRDQTVVGDTYDLVLPLANERGVRPALQSRPQTVLLHATTTRSWKAIAHRHVAGHDDCIVCRLPFEEDPAFGCSTVRVGAEKRMDASVPFLSGLAGLLLLANIIRLQHDRLMDRRTNFVSVDFSMPTPFARELMWECQTGCRVRMPAAARLRRVKGTRFAHLDGANVCREDETVTNSGSTS
jgi:hypothetical protein